MVDEPTKPAEETAAEEILEEIPPEVKETPTQKTDYTESEKRLYARTKVAEALAKKASADLEVTRKELAKAKLPISDVDAILEVQTATSGFDPEEVAELRLRAGALSTSLSKAREDKNFQMWQRGHKEEVLKNKALSPNTNQDEVDKPQTLEQKLVAAKTQDEKEKILDEYGLNPMKARNY